MNIFKKTQIQSYQIVYWNQFSDYLSEDLLLELIDENIKILNTIKMEAFLREIQIKNLYFIVYFNAHEKICQIGDKNLFTELQLLKIYPDHLDLMNFIKSFKENADKLLPDYQYVRSQYQVPTFNEVEFEKTHQQTQVLFKELNSYVNSYQYSFFEKVSDYGLNLVAQYDLIRIHILKFLAVLPTLDYDKSGIEVKRVFLESFRRLIEDNQKIKTSHSLKRLPLSLVLLFKLILKINSLLPAKFMANLARYLVGKMAERFIAGESIQTSKSTIQNLKATGREATLDQLGELVVSFSEAQHYENKVLELIDGVVDNYSPNEVNGAGLYKAHVSIKVSALCSDFKPQAFDYTYNLVAPRLSRILNRAHEKGVFVNIDAEHIHFRDLVFDIYQKVLLETDTLKSYQQTGIVVQAYLKDSIKHFYEIQELAKKRKIRMPIRLVKGAYWDAETIEAIAHNYSSPQFLNKYETDLNYKQLVYLSLKNDQDIHLAVASHNIEDHAFAEALRTSTFPNAPVIEHQCLHMTFEALSVSLSKMKWPTRNYMPIGNLLIGMAYLVRRIMENSSQVGILAQTRLGALDFQYKKPWDKLSSQTLNKETQAIDFSGDFKNIYPVRLYKKLSLNLTIQKLNELLKKIPFEYGSDVKIYSPSNTQLQIGSHAQDNKQSTESIIDLLFQNYLKLDWKTNSARRIESLLNFANYLKLEREELAALVVLESGKIITEALADVDEAIDFVNYYVVEYLKLEKMQPQLEPKGVLGVIAPWNFPLAIPCGMTISALVTGNHVILKPAEQTPLIAIKMAELLKRSGIPEEVFQLVLGDVEVGQAIVNHELINGVLFTGSKSVGTLIYKTLKTQLTSTKYPFPPMLKTSIAEMGGKNAIIVTSSAELDETVSGIIYSAFAHAGQKCSAASRIIVDNKVKHLLEKRLVEAVKDLKIGSSLDFSSTVNPVITKFDRERIQKTAIEIRNEIEKFHGRVLVDLTMNQYEGYCVGPMLVSVDSKHALNTSTYACKEIFGPIVHIIGYDHLDQAIQIFNTTEYALTGGVYSQSQDDLDYLIDKLESGNLYINRPNTGARVAIEPFGGYKMSGTGPKAGSFHYLMSLCQVRQNHMTASEPEVISTYEFLPTDFKFERGDINHFIKLINQTYKENLQLNFDSFYFESVRVIPGQKGFNDYQLNDGILIVYTQFGPSKAMLENLILNLLMGRPVFIITNGKTSYSQYKELQDLAMTAGFTKKTLEVINSDAQYVIKFLQQTLNSPIVLDLNSQELEKFSMMTKELMGQKDHLIKVIQSSDTFWDMTNKRHLFTPPRTLAINTMRHGAPLDLEI